MSKFKIFSPNSHTYSGAISFETYEAAYDFATTLAPKFEFVEIYELRATVITPVSPPQIQVIMNSDGEFVPENPQT